MDLINGLNHFPSCVTGISGLSVLLCVKCVVKLGLMVYYY